MDKKLRGILKQTAVLLIIFVLVAAVFEPAFAAGANKAPALNAEEITIVAGKSFNFNIMNKIKGSTYNWSVSNSKVAAISENGVVTGVGKGTTNIFCRISAGKTRYLLAAKVNVLKPAVKVDISNPVETLQVKEYYRLKADMIPASSNDIITWSSSDNSIAKVDSDGSFIAKKAGTVTITATSVSGRSDSVTIRITDKKTTADTDADDIITGRNTDKMSDLPDKNIASFSTSDTEKIYVRGVYTNFTKVTMATGTTRQIKAYIDPETATEQGVKYRSSAPGIAKVSDTGLITALSPGKAVITVAAVDGSKQTETIEVKVLDNLIITDELVDSDNEVIVLDKTYGNLTIDASVGDADIYFGGVIVKNILTMDSGEYSLFMYDSTAKEIVINNTSAGIETLAAEEDENKTPSLIVGENTRISELYARISASIRQEDGSAIEGLKVIQDSDGRVTVYLENYSGGLLLDTSLGDIEIVATGCNLSGVRVDGSNNSGSITLTNGGDTEIDNLTLNGAANVNLGIPANEVKLGSNAQGTSLTAGASIGTLHNQGSNSNITIEGKVGSIETDGAYGNINVAQGASVGSINMNGEGSSVSGEGEVSEVNVNADGCSIDTKNTVVNTGNAKGTKINGKDASDGSKTDSDDTSQEGGNPAPVRVTAITVTGEGGISAINTRGGTLQMFAAVEPANADNKEVSWSITEGSGLATISSSGLLTAAADGTVTVTASAMDGSGIRGSLTITITGQEESTEVTPVAAIGSITGTPRVGVELTAGALTPAEATVAYQWSISDTINGTYANIPGAVSSTYTPAAGDVGKYIKVTAAGTGDYGGSVTSTAAGPVESPESDFEFDSATKTITDYNGSGGVVVIPGSFGGITVEHIGESAFSGFDFNTFEYTPTNITRIIIPDTVKTIGQSAFYYSDVLTEVTFTGQSELTSIDAYAFDSCENLAVINIPDSVTSIGDSAFSYCSALETITLPEGLSDMGDVVFYGCLNLREITISESNNNYSCEDGILYNKDKSLLITCPVGKQSSALEIPDSVITINDSAFAGCENISGIIFKQPSNLTTICMFAFYGCYGLESIVLPDSLNEIKDYAFYWCINLKSITIGANVSIGYHIIADDDNFQSAYMAGGSGSYILNDDGTWENTTVPIPVTGVSISGMAKAGRTLTADVSPSYASNVTYKWQANTGAEGAYADIAGATDRTFVIPAELVGKTIRVTVNGENGSTATSTATQAVEDAVFITAIESISGTAKVGSELTAGAITPADATATYQWSISDTIDGTYVNIAGATLDTYTPVAGDVGKYIKVTVTGTGDYSGSVASTPAGPVGSPDSDFEFDGSTGTITGYIGEGGLVVIPAEIGGVTVESIGDYAFYDMYSVTSVRIPDTVTGIGKQAFSFCDGLTDIMIPESVTSIGELAFFECDALESITIPAGVNSIGYGTFNDCDNLQSVNVSPLNTVYSSSAGVLYTKDMTELIAYPKEKRDSVFEIPDGVTDIEDYAFDSNEYITGIIIPDSMERIGTSAFRGCTGLRSITIGPGVFIGSDILAYNGYFRDAYEAGGAGTYTADSYDGVWTKVVIPITAIGAIAGTPGVGAELTAGALTPAEATAVYQWSICDTIDGTYVNIPGAVSSTYTPVTGDAGKYIKVTATGTGDYSGSVTSPAAGPVESPVQVTVTGASITGTARVGETLTAVVTPGDATNVTYQWQANTGAEGAYADIAGATGQTFIISEELAGKTIRVIVNGDNGSSATSEATDIVEAADP